MISKGMTVFDLACALIAVFLVIRSVWATTANGKITVKGRTSGAFVGSIVLFIAVSLLAVIKTEEFLYPWLVPAEMAVTVAVSLLVKSGMCRDGIISTGKRVPFSEMEFFAIEAETPVSFRLRVHGFTKEYVLVFKQEFRAEIVKMLEENKVKFAQFEPNRKKEEK